MKLMFDVPKEYSDVNTGEVPKLYMKLKQLVEQIEHRFGLLESKKEKVIRVNLPESSDSEERTVYSEDISKTDIVEIYSQSSSENLWVSKVFNGGFVVSGGKTAVSIIAIIREVVV
jgi:hypothetical protein